MTNFDNADGPYSNQPTTLLEALNQLRDQGYGGQLIAGDDGLVRCINCDNRVEPEQLAIEGYYRLEGTSDAADMNLLAWARCPSCGDGGALTLGYGPNATAADDAVLGRLDLEGTADPGATPNRQPT